jgi:hypothetical protein
MPAQPAQRADVTVHSRYDAFVVPEAVVPEAVGAEAVGRHELCYMHEHHAG